MIGKYTNDRRLVRIVVDGSVNRDACANSDLCDCANSSWCNCAKSD